MRRELRTSARVDAIIPTTYRLETPGRSTGETVTRNVSLGGAQIFLPERLSLGTSVSVTLWLPTTGVLASSGRVAWQGRKFYTLKNGDRVVSTGVEFVGMTSVVQDRLAGFIERLLWRDRESVMSHVLQRLARLKR